MKKLLLTLLVLVSCGANALTMDITKDKNEYQVHMDGKFDGDTLNQFKDLYEVAGKNRVVIYINSRGGEATNVYDIMKLVNQNHNTTFVVDGVCASMCAWTAISGEAFTGELLFHGVRYKTPAGDKMDNTRNMTIQGFLWSRKGISFDLSKNWVGQDLVKYCPNCVQ